MKICALKNYNFEEVLSAIVILRTQILKSVFFKSQENKQNCYLHITKTAVSVTSNTVQMCFFPGLNMVFMQLCKKGKFEFDPQISFYAIFMR